MSAIQDQAQKIVVAVWGETAETAETADPTPAPTPTPGGFLALIMSIFQNLLPMLLKCLPVANRPQRVTRMFNRGLLGHQAQLREVIDQSCGEDDPKAAIHDGFVQVGRRITEAEVAAMLDEAK